MVSRGQIIVQTNENVMKHTQKWRKAINFQNSHTDLHSLARAFASVFIMLEYSRHYYEGLLDVVSTHIISKLILLLIYLLADSADPDVE